MLLCEDPKQEVSILVRLKGGGDDDILPRRQPEMAAYLPGVHEDLREAVVLILYEEVLLQANILDVLKLYVPWRWVQGGRGRVRRGDPESEAWLGQACGRYHHKLTSPGHHPTGREPQHDLLPQLPPRAPGHCNPNPVAPSGPESPSLNSTPCPSTCSQRWGCTSPESSPASSVPPLGPRKRRKREVRAPG